MIGGTTMNFVVISELAAPGSYIKFRHRFPSRCREAVESYQGINVSYGASSPGMQDAN